MADDLGSAGVTAPNKHRFVSVSVHVTGADGVEAAASNATDVELRKTQPNGAGCQPTCYQAQLQFRAATNQLVQTS